MIPSTLTHDGPHHDDGGGDVDVDGRDGDGGGDVEQCISGKKVYESALPIFSLLSPPGSLPPLLLFPSPSIRPILAPYRPPNCLPYWPHIVPHIVPHIGPHIGPHIVPLFRPI